MICEKKNLMLSFLGSWEDYNDISIFQFLVNITHNWLLWAPLLSDWILFKPICMIAHLSNKSIYYTNHRNGQMNFDRCSFNTTSFLSFGHDLQEHIWANDWQFSPFVLQFSWQIGFDGRGLFCVTYHLLSKGVRGIGHQENKKTLSFWLYYHSGDVSAWVAGKYIFLCNSQHQEKP